MANVTGLASPGCGQQRPQAPRRWCRWVAMQLRTEESMPIAEGSPDGTTDPTQKATSILRPDRSRPKEEKVGRRWLVFSFIFCPCHLPVVMALLAAGFGGSAFGALIGRNTIGVGIVVTLIYAAAVVTAFRHLRRAVGGVDCSTGSCEITPAPSK